MLPDQLVGVYKQYKQDTDSVASWLASSARAHGFPGDLLSTQSWDTQNPRVARLKGGAKKQAMNAASNKAFKSARFTVALNDFLPLADWIAKCTNPVVAVPDDFSATIDRLIRLRSGFSEMMRDHGAAADPESDEKHGYFVGILIAVRDALRPRMSVKSAAAAAASGQANTASGNTKTSSDSEKGTFINRFANLSVQEPSPDFVESFTSAAPVRPRQEPTDHTVYEAEPPVSMEDALELFLLLCMDLAKIRSSITTIWLNHRDAGHDLASAAVTTNVAISLARNMMNDFTPTINRFEGGASKIAQKAFLFLCLVKGYAPDEIRRFAQENYSNGTYELADAAYLIPASFLSSVAMVLQPGTIPLYEEGMFGHYDPESDRSTKSGPQKFQEDKILMVEFFTEMMTVIRSLPDYPVKDEFLMGMRELDKTREPSMPLLFAGQIFLDIHHIMRGATRRSFQAVMTETTKIETQIDSFFEFHRNLKIEAWPADNDAVLKDLRHQIQWMHTDRVHKVKVRQLQKLGSHADGMEPHRILIQSPVLAGMWLFSVRQQMHDIGITMANAWVSITNCAHLYNALQKQKLLNGLWLDMEVIIDTLGGSSFWVGGEPPSTLDDCFRKYCLQTGASASSFTTNRRRKTDVLSRAGPRVIEHGAPVSQMFPPDYISSERPVTDWTPEMISTILGKSLFTTETSSEDGTVTIVRTSDFEKRTQPTKKPKNKNRKKKGGKGKAKTKTTVQPEEDVEAKESPSSAPNSLSPGELISALTLTLQAESLQLALPYVMMHLWCWKLLRRVKDGCDAVLREVYTPAYMKRETEVPFVIGYILMWSDGPPDGRLLEGAAAVFNDMISSAEGRLAISHMRSIGLHGV